MAKEMLINVSEGEECRIALVEDGRLEELYMERASATSHVGNIYKGKVTNVEASIQAAFVDFGLGRNGFLHVSDLLPSYFGRKGEDVDEFVGKKMARRDRPPIQRCLRRGDEIIAQVIKEGIGTKGPTLSSYLSISGKMLVMMPGVSGRGVSRKIEDEDERRRLKQILVSLSPPEDCGFIIRTESVGKSKAEIERDLKYLARLWDQIKRKRDSGPGPMELYTEGDLVTRTIRDVFNTDVDRIVVDNEQVADRVREVIKLTSPRAKDKLEVYTQAIPLFHKYGIERDIELMYSRHVPLPSGGSLVIDSTEAVVAIDVNSGKNRDHSDAEMTAFKVDMEAADEICRQLRLRDLGGVIICDFIDLRFERNRRELEKRLDDNFRKDRAKTKVLRMSQFGIVEITRQRMRPSLKRSVYFDCPHCKGAGLVKTPESMGLDVMRRLAMGMNDLKVFRAELSVCADVAFYLNNKKRRSLSDLEERTAKRVVVKSDPALGLDEMRLDLYDNRDGMVVLQELNDVMTSHPHTSQLNVRQPGGPPAGRGGKQGASGRSADPRRGGERQPPNEAQQRNDQNEEDRFDFEDERDSHDEQSGEREAADPADHEDPQEQEAAAQENDRGGPPRDNRDNRDTRDNRDNRQQNQPRSDQRGGRDNRNNRPQRDARSQRDDRPQTSDRGQRDNQSPRDNQGQRDDRGQRDAARSHQNQGGRTPDPRRQDNRGQDNRGQGQQRQGSDSRPDNRDVRDNRDPRNNRDVKDNRDVRDNRDVKDNRNARTPDRGPVQGGRPTQGNRPAQGGRPDPRRENQPDRRPQPVQGGRPPQARDDEHGPEDQQDLPFGENTSPANAGQAVGENAPVGDQGEGGGPRRRRRRRGRGRGRGGQGQNAPATAMGEYPAAGPNEGALDDRNAQPNEGVSYDESRDAEEERDNEADEFAGEQRGGPAENESAGKPADEAQPVMESRDSEESNQPVAETTAESPQAEPVTEKPSRARRGTAATGGRGRGGKTPKTAATVKVAKSEATNAAIESESESGEAESKGKGRARGTRGGRGRKKKPADVETTAGGPPAATTPVRIAAEVTPTARKGKADKHLVKETEAEIHLPETPRRPRSYSDLDAIPDDFD